MRNMLYPVSNGGVYSWWLVRAQPRRPKQGQWLTSPTAEALSNAALQHRGAGIPAALAGRADRWTTSDRFCEG